MNSPRGENPALITEHDSVKTQTIRNGVLSIGKKNCIYFLRNTAMETWLLTPMPSDPALTLKKCHANSPHFLAARTKISDTI